MPEVENKSFTTNHIICTNKRQKKLTSNKNYQSITTLQWMAWTGAEWKVSKIVMCFGSVIIFVHLWPYMTTGLVGRRLTVLSINFSCDGKLPQWPLAVDPCTVSNTKNLCEFKTLPYLPVYNVRLCIIHTPISDQILRKKKNKLLNTKVKLYTIIYFNELGKLLSKIMVTSFTYL